MAMKANVEWRDPYNDGGILSLWTELKPDAAHYGDFVGDSTITVFKDEYTDDFVALETHYPEEVVQCKEMLGAQDYPHVDLPQAGLRDVHPADALLWAYYNLTPQLSAPNLSFGEIN